MLTVDEYGRIRRAHRETLSQRMAGTDCCIDCQLNEPVSVCWTCSADPAAPSWELGRRDGIRP
jgi:hypothetical protein